MKNTSVWFAVLSSMVVTACAAEATDRDPGDEPEATATQAVSTFNLLKNKQFAQCADAPGGAFNVVLKLATCTSLTEDHWASVPVGPANLYTLVNQNSGLCMEVNNGTATPGELVDEFTCNGLASEQWLRTDIVIGGISYAQFKHNGTNLCLDTVGGTGSNLMQWTCAAIGSNDAQLWRVL